MSKVTKEVRFYDTIAVTAKTDDKPERAKTVKADFWPRVLTKIEGYQTRKERSANIGRRDYHGVVLRPTSPAINHLQVGRLRDLSEHLEETDLDSGDVEPLVLEGNRRVSEPTFVVPFGSSGRVAIMSPGRSTRPETIANWLTLVLGLAPKGKSIRFRPVVDEDALEKLLNSQGAVGVEFHIDADKQVTDSVGVPLLDAVDDLLTSGPSVGTLMVGWSLGRNNGTMADKTMIKKLAAKVMDNDLARRATVNMVVEDADGNIRHETHNLFEDHIVAKASWEVNRNERSETSAVLDGIADAIEQFQDRPDV